jgi:ABC-type sulfate/molybdate transport systems ATPase subunit
MLLLDEPARGLDAPLREELYALLRQVRTEFNLPILLVTHDLDECFTLADEMAVVQAGRIVQSGPPRKLLDQPATVDVARLLGISNLLPAEITALDPGKNTSRIQLREFELTGTYYPGRLRGDQVWLCARAEELRAVPHAGSRPGPNQVPARLTRVTQRAQAVRLDFAGDLTVDVSREQYERQKDNKEWLVEFPPQAVRVLSRSYEPEDV